MNKKIAIIIIIIILLVVAAALLYFLYFKDSSDLSKIPIVGEKISNQFSQSSKDSQAQLPIQPVKDEIKKIVIEEETLVRVEPTEADLSRMAASFAERFGSYSNQSNFKNIDDLKIFMSSRMVKWSDNYVDQLKQQGGTSSIYYGITTKAIFQEVQDFDDDVGKALILVKTLRQEATGTMSNKSDFSQDIVISFIKQGSAWKVDSANWQTL